MLRTVSSYSNPSHSARWLLLELGTLPDYDACHAYTASLITL